MIARLAPFSAVISGVVRVRSPPTGAPEPFRLWPTVRVPSLLAVILSLAAILTEEKPTATRFRVVPSVGRLLAS